MKSVLIHDGKWGKLIWDVSSPELKERALHALFNYMDALWYYDCGGLSDQEQRLLAASRAGHTPSIRALLTARADAEYEGWSIHDVEPCE